MIEDFCYPADEYVLLGKITRVHGLRGEVKILSFSGQPENFTAYHELVLVDDKGTLSTPFAVERVRTQGKTAIISLATINDRSMAETIEGCGVLLAIDDLPKPGEGEFYWHQFVGKLVVDHAGQSVGRVESLFNNGAQDILVVREGKKEILIPVVKDIIKDETKDCLHVDLPPGLLDLAEE